MALGPFFVGQTPGEPALITITSPDGTPRDLSDYQVSGKLYSPDGTDVSAGSFTQINDPAVGLVQFDFPVPSGFDVPGVYVLQFELTNPDDDDVLDFTTTVEMDVYDELPSDATGLVVDSDYVFSKTNTPVSTDDIRRAQNDVSIFLGVDIATAWESMTENSQYWVGLAIAHQSTWEQTVSGPAVGATRVKAGSVEVTYGSTGTSAEGVYLHPMARICLQRVATSTMYATPFLGDMGRTPYRPMWVPVS